MDVLDHAVRIGEVGGIEVVRAPGIFGPVGPVQHDVVDRQLAAAVLVQHAEQLILALVTLAALPEAVRPLGQHHRLAGEFAIAGDHLIGIATGDHVIVHHLPGFGPQREIGGFGLRQRITVQQRDVAGVDQVPLDLDLVAGAGRQLQREFVMPRVPVLAPAVDHQLAVHVQLDVFAAVQGEGMATGGLRLDRAFPDHLRAPTLSAVLALGRERGEILDVLVVHFRLAALDAGLAIDDVAGGQRAGLALGIEHLQRGLQRLQPARVAQAGDRVVVPEQTVIAAGDDERHRHVDVALEQLDVAALLVHPALLMLPEPVDRLIAGRLEALAHAVVRLALHGERAEAAATGALGQQRLALRVTEAHVSIGFGNIGADPGRDQAHAATALLHREAWFALHGDAHQARRAREVAVGVGADPHDVVVHQFQPDLGRAGLGRHHHHTVVQHAVALGHRR